MMWRRRVLDRGCVGEDADLSSAVERSVWKGRVRGFGQQVPSAACVLSAAGAR